MKVVINRCLGCFTLSDEARRLLHTRKSKYLVLTPEAEFWHPKEGADLQGHRTSMEALIRAGSYTAVPGGLLSDDYGIAWEEDEGRRRADPELVAVVEELGDRASGPEAKLLVIEVPDGVDWLIHARDGKEQIGSRDGWLNG